MPKFNELSQQQIDVDMSQVPEQFGDFAPAPQPGKNYGLQLPRFTPDTDFKEYDADENRVRLALQFGGRDSGIGPLTIVESPFGEGVGDPVKTRLTNEEKKFNDADGSAVSPLHYLMKEAFGLDMSGRTNADFANALIKLSALGIDKFRATVKWQTNCSEKTVRYVWDETQGKNVEDPDGNHGCGQRWADKERKNRTTGVVTAEIPRDENGKYQTRFTCYCGAALQPFVELQNFKAFEGQAMPSQEDIFPPAPVKAQAPAAAPAKAATSAPAAAKPVTAPPANGGAKPATTGKPQAQAQAAAPKPSAPRPGAPAKK